MVWGDSGSREALGGMSVCLQGMGPACVLCFLQDSAGGAPHPLAGLASGLAPSSHVPPFPGLDSELGYLCPRHHPRPTASICRVLAWVSGWSAWVSSSVTSARPVEPRLSSYLGSLERTSGLSTVKSTTCAKKTRRGKTTATLWGYGGRKSEAAPWPQSHWLG